MKTLILIMATASVFAFATESRAADKKIVNLTVTEKGFEPSSVDVKPGSDVVLVITRKTDSTCAKQVQVASKGPKADLPLNKPVTLKVGILEKGEVRFACGMDMVSGVLVVK